jgi:hypothetical protein
MYSRIQHINRRDWHFYAECDKRRNGDFILIPVGRPGLRQTNGQDSAKCERGHEGVLVRFLLLSFPLRKAQHQEITTPRITERC